MNPIDYVESVKERLSTDSIIISFDIIREFSNLNEGFIRVRANLINSDILDFSEFVEQANDLELVSYRYQWLDKSNYSAVIARSERSERRSNPRVVARRLLRKVRSQ